MRPAIQAYGRRVPTSPLYSLLMNEHLTARRMWSLYEPVHAVAYFMPRSRELFEQAGLRGFWRGYFAARVAPLGRVGPAPVLACFAHFAPRIVERALPALWELIAPDEALPRRSAPMDVYWSTIYPPEVYAAVTEVLASVGPAGPDLDGLAEAAGLMERVAAAADCTGRVLAAANADLPRPDHPLARLWLATTVLREHRGDGHVAALVTHGLGGCEILAWRCGLDLSRASLQPARGWTDQEWDEARARLAERGWLDGDGRATEAGVQAYRDIEDATDRIAEAPWRALGAGEIDRLEGLLAPLSRACHELTPSTGLIGLPPPAKQAG